MRETMQTILYQLNVFSQAIIIQGRSLLGVPVMGQAEKMAAGRPWGFPGAGGSSPSSPCTHGALNGGAVFI